LNDVAFAEGFGAAFVYGSECQAAITLARSVVIGPLSAPTAALGSPGIFVVSRNRAAASITPRYSSLPDNLFRLESFTRHLLPHFLFSPIRHFITPAMDSLKRARSGGRTACWNSVGKRKSTSFQSGMREIKWLRGHNP